MKARSEAPAGIHEQFRLTMHYGYGIMYMALKLISA
jgi:hypothetical protein